MKIYIQFKFFFLLIVPFTCLPIVYGQHQESIYGDLCSPSVWVDANDTEPYTTNTTCTSGAIMWIYPGLRDLSTFKVRWSPLLNLSGFKAQVCLRERGYFAKIVDKTDERDVVIYSNTFDYYSSPKEPERLCIVSGSSGDVVAEFRVDNVYYGAIISYDINTYAVTTSPDPTTSSTKNNTIV